MTEINVECFQPSSVTRSGSWPKVPAWRAQRRLHQRWAVLAGQRRKPAGVVAIACARELAAFCWEAALID